MQHSRIAIIGCGNMGTSLIGGLVAAGYPANRVCGADPDPEKRHGIEQRFGVRAHADNRDAATGAEVIVLAVKPQVMRATVVPLAQAVHSAKPLWLSIAAGIRTDSLARWTGPEAAIVRAMPNTPALIGAGAAALYANARATRAQRDIAESILRSVGITVWLEDEALLDAVTAISGSGPAYFFLLMELMKKTAVKLGLTPEQADLLTLQTAFGAARMALESAHDPATLRVQVTSPGGTTERAVKILIEGGLEELIGRALSAARERAAELADSFGQD
jgi:pyrroline-5-carboxylate reductase